MATIVDSYSESNQDGQSNLSAAAADNQADGQSFTGDGGTLNSVKFYLKKSGSPTGNAVAKIYAHTGTFGTSSLPTGTVLATSGNFDVSSLTTSYALITFTFSGAEKITLTNATKFVVVVQYDTGGTITNNVQVGIDTSSSTHDGNKSGLRLSNWTAQSTHDICFYVYKDDFSGPFPTFLRS